MNVYEAIYKHNGEYVLDYISKPMEDWELVSILSSCMINNKELFKQILERKTLPLDDLNTLLTRASIHGYDEEVNELIALGANDFHGALLAPHYLKASTVKILEAHGAVITEEELHEMLDDAYRFANEEDAMYYANKLGIPYDPDRMKASREERDKILEDLEESDDE